MIRPQSKLWNTSINQKLNIKTNIQNIFFYFNNVLFATETLESFLND